MSLISLRSIDHGRLSRDFAATRTDHRQCEGMGDVRGDKNEPYDISLTSLPFQKNLGEQAPGIALPGGGESSPSRL